MNPKWYAEGRENFKNNIIVSIVYSFISMTVLWFFVFFAAIHLLIALGYWFLMKKAEREFAKIQRLQRGDNHDRES